jgi:hypothetical protein
MPITAVGLAATGPRLMLPGDSTDRGIPPATGVLR